MNQTIDALDFFKEIMEVKYRWTVGYEIIQNERGESRVRLRIDSIPKPEVIIWAEFSEKALFDDRDWIDFTERQLIIAYINALEEQ